MLALSHSTSEFDLLLEAAALVGLGAAPLWTSKCTYLTDTGAIHAEMKHVHKDVIVNRFFGIFFMFFQSGLFCCLLFECERDDRF